MKPELMGAILLACMVFVLALGCGIGRMIGWW